MHNGKRIGMLSKLKSKIANFKYIKNIKSLCERIHTFMKDTTVVQYRQWEFKDDKNLYTKVTEYFISNGLKYIWTGILINFMLHQWQFLRMSIGNTIASAITYWLLTNVVLMIRTGKK